MQVLLLMSILSIASVTFSNGEEEEDRDELQEGFFEVDYMLQVPIEKQSAVFDRFTYSSALDEDQKQSPNVVMDRISIKHCQVNPRWSTGELRQLMKLMKRNQTEEATAWIDKGEVFI